MMSWFGYFKASLRKFGWYSDSNVKIFSGAQAAKNIIVTVSRIERAFFRRNFSFWFGDRGRPRSLRTTERFKYT